MLRHCIPVRLQERVQDLLLLLYRKLVLHKNTDRSLRDLVRVHRRNYHNSRNDVFRNFGQLFGRKPVRVQTDVRPLNSS